MSDLKINGPPNRKNLKDLFKAMNLQVSPVKLIDCLIYCRGKEMDEADPNEYSITKLVKWFFMNLRTLNHISLNKDSIADHEWLEEKERTSQMK